VFVCVLVVVVGLLLACVWVVGFVGVGTGKSIAIIYLTDR
jgi:hypothetical protein